MIQYRRLAIGAAALTLVLGGAAAMAQQSATDGGKGRMEGMHGQMAGSHGGGAGHEVMGQLMTPQEREAMREKMKAAKTPEERQALAAGMRTEMEKRAKEKGMTLPERHARMGGLGGVGMGGMGMGGMAMGGMGHGSQGQEGSEHKH